MSAKSVGVLSFLINISNPFEPWPCVNWTAQAKTIKDQLNERIPLGTRARTRSTSSTISHRDSGQTRLANVCPVLQRVVFTNGVQWRRPSPLLPHLTHSRSLPYVCLPFNDLFIKKIDCDVVPPPPPRKVVLLVEQQFKTEEQCFDLNANDDDDDSLFFKPSPSKHNNSIQRCRKQVEVDVQGSGNMVMALV